MSLYILNVSTSLVTVEKFFIWADAALVKEGFVKEDNKPNWSEFCRRSGIPAPTISRAKKGTRQLSLDVYDKFAKTLKYKLNTVLLAAGWDVEPAHGVDDPMAQRLLAAMDQMNEEEQLRLLEYAKFELELQERRKAKKAAEEEAPP